MRIQADSEGSEAVFGAPGNAHPGNAIESSILRRRATIEAFDARSLDLSRADEWRVLVTLNGTPSNYLWLPGPGDIEDPALVEAAVGAHAHPTFYHNLLVEELRRRLGARQPSLPRPSCSVVVCTHRRPDHITDCLAALAKLDPAPEQVIVVDNDPGDSNCRRQVEQAGALYVREDRRGLDNARNAGLRRVSTELVAFTDDDCVPSLGWLRSLGELFADPLVAAVTGPGFAYSLDTLAQERFERTGGFTRGLQRQTWDWTRLHPAASMRTGAGANMIFRRATLERLGEVFPPELDAGTSTQTGGDMYALYKVLANGYRVVYDPGSYVYHQHRADLELLRRAFWGYGVGLSSTLAKLFVEEKELTAPLVWRWLWTQHAAALRGYIAGRLDKLDVAIGWDYLRGGFAGPAAWRRAKGAASTTGAARPVSVGVAGIGLPTVAAQDVPVAAHNGREHGPTTSVHSSRDDVVVSVVIPTRDRAEILQRCLHALAAQVDCPPFEVIVVDDGQNAEGMSSIEVPDGISARVLATGGGLGPAASRNLGAQHSRGELLLFLDDDLIVDPHLIASHHNKQHEETFGRRVVVGYSAPRPTRSTFVTQRVVCWWEDHYRAKARALSMSFTHMLSGNMSISRRAFMDLGCFDAAFGRLRREDWEFGIRALRSGFELCYEPSAVARHEFSLTTGGLLRMASLEGNGDALLHSSHPSVSPILRRPGLTLRLRHPLYALGLALLGFPAVRQLSAGILTLLERARARNLWIHLFRITWGAAYLRGLISGGYRPASKNERPESLRIELTSRAAIAPPSVIAPTIDVTIGGRRVARITPRGGYWDASIAEQVAEAVSERWWPELPLKPPRGQATESADLNDVTVICGPLQNRRLRSDASRLRSAGASVITPLVQPRARGDAWWRSLDSAIRSAPTQLVAISLPGVGPRQEWLGAAKICLAGDRVAAVLGRGVAGKHPHPLVLLSRSQMRAPFPSIGPATQYVAVRRDLYRALGGFDLTALSLGPYAVLMDYVERAINSGYVVGHRDTPGLKPVLGRRMMRRHQRERRKSRAALLARHARVVGGVNGGAWWLRYGLAPALHELLAGALRRGPGRFEALQSLLAFAAGSLCGLRAGDGATTKGHPADDREPTKDAVDGAGVR